MNSFPNRGNFLPSAAWQNTPRRVSGLSGWWKQGTGITSSSERVSQWDDQSGNARHLLQATGANQPIYLPWSGANYLWLPGVASNIVSTPSKAITGNFTITLDFELQDWTPGSTVLISQKFTGTSGFKVFINTNGKPQLNIGDGASEGGAAAVTAPTWTDGTRHTLKIIWVDGASGSATFFYDGVQSGSAVALNKTLANASAVFSIGDALSPNAKVYSASITNSASTTYYSVDFTQVAEGTTSITQGGDTYTVNASGAKQAQIVGSAQVVGDGAAYFMRASYTQAQPVTRFFLARRNLWSITTAARYTTDGVGANSAAILDATSTPSTRISAGTPVAENTGMTLSAWHAVAAVFNGASSSYKIDANAATTGNASTTTTGGLTIFADGGTPTASTFSASQTKEIIEYNRALSASEVNQVMRYLSRIGNLGLAL